MKLSARMQCGELRESSQPASAMRTDLSDIHAGSARADFSHRRRVPIPWPKFMKALTRADLPLKANEVAVALVILSYADMTTLTCFPSIDEIRRHAHVSRNTVCRTIKKLEKLRLVTVSKRKQASGRFDRNEYDFNLLRQQVYQVCN